MTALVAKDGEGTKAADCPTEAAIVAIAKTEAENFILIY
jgi:hypothetical protein